ncbi:MAG: hypothetical protein RI983_610 [Bacteroidota bacterium]|jgi:hypothetical protein
MHSIPNVNKTSKMIFNVSGGFILPLFIVSCFSGFPFLLVAASMVNEMLSKIQIPYIFCTDLNAVPSSCVYQQLRKETKDTFLEAGAGLKGT